MEDIIYALETRLLYQRRDDFDQLLAADFFEIGTSGRTYTKAMQLAAVTDEPRVDIPEISAFRIVVLSDHCIQARYDTLESSGRRAHRSSIWKKNTQWQMYFHQGTPY